MKALLLALVFLASVSTSMASTTLPTFKELSELTTTSQKNSSKSDLYWMAMNIYHEAGNQPLIGKIAVGIVT